MKKIIFFCTMLAAAVCYGTGEAHFFQKGTNPIIIKASTAIVAEIKIEARSAKEVFATITFTNTSSDNFYLYRPILPSDTMFDNDFEIKSQNAGYLAHIKGPSNQKYYPSDTDLLPPAVIPDVSAQHFQLIAPGKRLSYTMNIATHYRFHKGVYTCFYSVFMPAVSKDIKQVYELDPYDKHTNKPKPVYFVIGSRNKATIRII